MKEYEFELKFRLPNTALESDAYVEKLGEQGCNDALVGIGYQGRIALNFCRSSSSALEAVSSAIEDVKRIIPGARLLEAAPDFVGLTDVAEILGCSRQYMRKLMIGGGVDFPCPVHDGKTALWRLSAVLGWLRDSRNYQIENSLVDVATVTMQFNIAKETLGSDPDLQKSILRLVS